MFLWFPVNLLTHMIPCIIYEFTWSLNKYFSHTCMNHGICTLWKEQEDVEAGFWIQRKMRINKTRLDQLTIHIPISISILIEMILHNLINNLEKSQRNGDAVDCMDLFVYTYHETNYQPTATSDISCWCFIVSVYNPICIGIDFVW